MPATLTRLIFFASGELHAIVSTDSDDGDLAHHRGPFGAIFVDVPKGKYESCQTLRDQMALALPLVATKDIIIASALTAKIQKIDAAAVDAVADVL